MSTVTPDLTGLVRIRWAVRGVLALGVVASTLANILHANPNPISQTIAAWPPVALLLTVELISRVPIDRRSLAAARLVATATIAGIAAWVSYWHMVGVAARYGETGASPYLLPLCVDGLVVVASICLVELGGRIRPVQQPAAAAAAAAVPVEPPAAVAAEVVEPPRRPAPPPAEEVPAAVPPPAEPARPRNRRRRPIEQTRQLASEVVASEPDLKKLEIAKRLDISPRRLREVFAAG